MQQHGNRVYEPAKIKSMLQFLAGNKLAVECWQQAQGKRNAITTKCFKYQNSELYLASKDSLDEFDQTQLMYCHIPDQQILFKSTIVFTSTYKIALDTPHYFHVQENRKYPRKDLSSQNIFASYHLGHHTPSIHRIFNHQLKIIDYSLKGISLQVPFVKANAFYVGDLLTLRLPTKDLSVKEARIVHLTKSNPAKSDPVHFKMGLSFTQGSLT